MRKTSFENNASQQSSQPTAQSTDLRSARSAKACNSTNNINFSETTTSLSKSSANPNATSSTNSFSKVPHFMQPLNRPSSPSRKKPDSTSTTTTGLKTVPSQTLPSQQKQTSFAKTMQPVSKQNLPADNNQQNLTKRKSATDSNPTFHYIFNSPISQRKSIQQQQVTSPTTVVTPVGSVRRRKMYAHLLSFKEIDKLRHGFDAIDSDKDGLLNKADMNRFMSENNLETGFTDLAFKLFSRNGLSMNFDDFKEYIAVMTRMETQPRIFYKVLFDFIDVDGSGGIDQKELMQFCELIKDPLTPEEAKRTIDELDDRGTGTLHFDALCKWFGV